MKKQSEPRIKYDPPKARWLIKIGEQYYRRIQPVPWAYTKPDLKIFKKHKQLITEKPKVITEAAPAPAATQTTEIQSAPRSQKTKPAHIYNPQTLF